MGATLIKVKQIVAVTALGDPGVDTNFATEKAVRTVVNTVAAPYKEIFSVAGSHIAAKVAGTYALGYGDPFAVSGTGTLYPQGVYYLDSADFPSAAGYAAKLRLRVGLFINATAPTGNFTFGLYPVTKGAGAAGLSIYTLGTVVTNSTCVQNTPSASTAYNLTSSDFTFPSAGWYCIGVLTTATVAASSLVQAVARLQMRNA